MELSVLPRKLVVISKILRFQGSFDQACRELERCLAIMRPHDGHRYQVLCNLADTYCDLGLPEKAHGILSSEVETVKRTPWRGKPLRSLLVATIEPQIQKGHYACAENTIKELQVMFSNLATVDVSDELRHMRVLLGSARVSYHMSGKSGTLEKLNAALIHIQPYRSFKEGGYIHAVIQLSISLLHLELGHIAEADKVFKDAASVLRTGVMEFWIPGLRSWRQTVEQSIQSRTNWTIGGVGHALDRGYYA